MVLHEQLKSTRNACACMEYTRCYCICNILYLSLHTPHLGHLHPSPGSPTHPSPGSPTPLTWVTYTPLTWVTYTPHLGHLHTHLTWITYTPLTWVTYTHTSPGSPTHPSPGSPCSSCMLGCPSCISYRKSTDDNINTISQVPAFEPSCAFQTYH